ncbi:putative ran guanine nucleotide release factor [Micractinium conductrix]|uniref:Ran guanine nucleotide release factor n=1 Tax=Micractinium conductrix TaxID=554055 RepID=A0A2P6V4L5_9CHLO|nr:putative ran guanine nucleotide release factor [Micractinium conductrix]|eukprot:PSC69030.1 putative ran guanine nucleotide release factor [Micractinium conductrix]
MKALAVSRRLHLWECRRAVRPGAPLMIDDTLVPRQLFGGAASLWLPQRFADISDFRPIPDHQEVFADANVDQSLVVEIVEHQPVADSEAGAFFFQDQAQHNEAAHTQMDEVHQLGPADMPGLPAECYRGLVVGQQLVAKGRQGTSALNKVQVLLCCVRLPHVGSDVLITLNSPIFISERSAAAEHAGAGYKGVHLTAPALFRQILATFSIADWGLFDGGDGGGAPQ